MRRGRNYYGRNNWAGKIRAEGREVLDSPFMNACAHHFQLMTFWLGDQMDQAAPLSSGEGELWRGNPLAENYDIAALRFRTETGVPILYYTAHPLRTKNLGQMGLAEFEEGRLTWGRGEPFRMILKDGKELSLDPAGDAAALRKLEVAIACVREGGSPQCGPRVGLSHLRAVRLAQAWPIREIPAERKEILEEGVDRFVCVRGLEEAFTGAAEAWALPAEAGYSFA